MTSRTIDVDRFRQRQVHCADTVVCKIGDMSSGTEIVTYVLADVPIVFDHQYTDAVCTLSLCHGGRPPVHVAETY
jgi:hypothetical protein